MHPNRRIASPWPAASAHSPLRRRLLLAPGAAGLLGGAQPMLAAPAAARRFGDTFGLGVKFSQGEPESHLPLLKELGVRWVRDVIGWAGIEAAPGKYIERIWTQFRRRLEFYREHDIGLVALLTLDNAKAYPATPDAPHRPHDPEAFGRFAAVVARLLRAEGVRFVIEIGNEPHNSQFAKTVGGPWQGGSANTRMPAAWVQHYVRMVKAAVREVKAVDPSIKLLSDDDMWVVHYWYLEAGLPKELDGFAVHPYVNHNPERTNVAPDTDWARPFALVDADRSFASAVRRLREQGQAKLGRAPEIWITEWGWPVGPGAAGPPISEDKLVAWLPRAFILSAAAGVEVLVWFSSQDSVDGPMGLMRNDGGKRDSYRAFRTMNEQLGALSLPRQVAGQKQPTAGLQAFLFEGQGGRKLVAWTADGKPARLPLPRGGDAAQAIDALGQPVAADNGRVTLGAAPLYLSAGWTDAAVDASLAAAD